MSEYTDDDLLKIDDFVKKLDQNVQEIRHYIKFLKFPDKYQGTIDEGLDILKKKVKEMKKSYTVDEIKGQLKVKKILNEGGSS